MGIIYFCIILLVNVLGSFVGMGGSLIIKPVFSMISPYSLEVIIFCSNLAVLVMSGTSFITSIINKQIKFNKQIIGIILGSLVGGMIGSYGLNYFLSIFGNSFKIFQNLGIIFFICIAILYQCMGKVCSKIWENYWEYFVIGLFCGFSSIILGIGGGPINVFLLLWLTGMKLKQATTYSLLSVLTAITIRVALSMDTVSRLHVPISLVMIFITAAAFGGILGIIIKRYLPNRHFKILYISALICAMIINALNLWL